MADIKFPLSSSPGSHLQANGGRLINAYVEKLGDGARNQTVWGRVPGLALYGTGAGLSHSRGMFSTGSSVLVAFDNQMARLDNGGAIGILGVFNGTLPVTFARNNKAPVPDYMGVSPEDGAYILGTGSAPVPLGGATPQFNSVSSLGGYFILTAGNGQIFASELNSTTINPLSFTTAQARPGTLYRGVTFRNTFFAFKTSSIELYSNAGTSPFPLAFETMIPRGLAGPFAVAGSEDGWSNELIWVGDDSVVYKLDGYNPTPISNHDVSRAIEGVADKNTIQAFVYDHGGHAIWCLKSPSWTWCYDLTTKQWHERESHLRNHWRAGQTVKAFGEWLAGDEATGKIFSIASNTHAEDQDPLVWEVWSTQGAEFPSRRKVPRADFDFAVGIGILVGVPPIETDPVVEISWSADGGVTFTEPLYRKLGQQGATRTDVMVLNPIVTGPKGVQCKLKISDPVQVALLGGSMAIEQRAA